MEGTTMTWQDWGMFILFSALIVEMGLMVLSFINDLDEDNYVNARLDNFNTRLQRLEDRARISETSVMVETPQEEQPVKTAAQHWREDIKRKPMILVNNFLSILILVWLSRPPGYKQSLFK